MSRKLSKAERESKQQFESHMKDYFSSDSVKRLIADDKSFSAFVYVVSDTVEPMRHKDRVPTLNEIMELAKLRCMCKYLPKEYQMVINAALELDHPQIQRILQSFEKELAAK